MDQETLAYLIWQKDNQYANLWTEANLQNWYTDTQWLPRGDYYRLGDSLFSTVCSIITHIRGVDYATIHTDVMVNNPNLFAYMPFDPVSNTSGTFSSGRFYTNHELDMPINLGNVMRFVPYVQGQAVGWTDQLGGGPLGHLPSGAMGRIWGAAGLAPSSRPGRSTPGSRANSGTCTGSTTRSACSQTPGPPGRM